MRPAPVSHSSLAIYLSSTWAPCNYSPTGYWHVDGTIDECAHHPERRPPPAAWAAFAVRAVALVRATGAVAVPPAVAAIYWRPVSNARIMQWNWCNLQWRRC